MIIKTSNSNVQQTTKQKKPEQILLFQVRSFLQQKHNIKISIPTLHNLLDTKVNLKIAPGMKIPFTIRSGSNANSVNPTSNIGGEDMLENRYKLVIQYIEDLLSSSSLDLIAIQSFMQVLNSIINTDIEIMQKNQVIRSNSFKMKEKLVFKIQQTSRKTNIVVEKSQKIHDKADIITFLAIDIKNYLQGMKLVEDQYESVRTVQIHTPLKIDKIYQYQYSSQQDYFDHYQPLLEVLVRFRANVNNLFESVRQSQRIDMPLKSVNLLATCKNLLTQLQPFLITKHCAYNRLIFHVVTQQSQNMKLISGFYKHYLQFVKSLVYNVFKCVYLGHLFKDHYFQLSNLIQHERNNIITLVLGITASLKNVVVNQIDKKLSEYGQNLQKIRNRIKKMQRIICYGKTSIMKQYLEQKICKKLNLLLIKKNQVKTLQNQLQNTKNYKQNMLNLSKQIQQNSKFKKQLQKHIQIIGRQVPLSQRMSLMLASSEGSSDQLKREKLFRDDYLQIQQRYLKLAQIQRNVRQSQTNCLEPKLQADYFPVILSRIKEQKQEISQIQVKLLNSYQHLLQAGQEKEQEANELCKKTVSTIVQYLLNQQHEDGDGSVYTAMGGQILNQDENCNKVKQLLSNLDKAQFMVKNTSKNNKQKSQPQLKRLQALRKFLQWLLIMFQSSMDEHILQNIIDKMDFNEQKQGNLRKNIAKVNQLLSQVQKHNRQVLKIIKQIQLRNNIKNDQKQKQKQRQKDKEKKKSGKMTTQNENQKQKDKRQQQIQTTIYNKIFRIARQRLKLYELVQIIYSDCLSVYCDMKINPTKNGKIVENYDIEGKGVNLFDKKLFEYALLCYQSLNKIAVLEKQLNDSNLITKTKNYLNDDILEPFNNKLQNFIRFNQKQTLQLALGLQKSIQIQKTYKTKLKKWQQSALQLDSKTPQPPQQYTPKLKQKSRELVQMEKQLNSIMQLSKKKFVILNIEQAKKIQKQCEQYFEIAGEVDRKQDLSAICQQMQSKNEKLNQIVQYIRSNGKK